MDVEKKLKEFSYSETDSILPGLDFTKEMAQQVYRQSYEKELLRNRRYKNVLYITALISLCIFLITLSQNRMLELVGDLTRVSAPVKQEKNPTGIQPKKFDPTVTEELSATDFLSQKVVRQALEKIYHIYPEAKSFTLEKTVKQQIHSLGNIPHLYYSATLRSQQGTSMFFRIHEETGEFQEFIRFLQEIKYPSAILSDVEIKEKGISFLQMLCAEQVEGYEVDLINRYVRQESVPNNIYSMVLRNPIDSTKPSIIVNITGDELTDVQFVIKN